MKIQITFIQSKIFFLFFLKLIIGVEIVKFKKN
jgi:hypothetical protein